MQVDFLPFRRLRRTFKRYYKCIMADNESLKMTASQISSILGVSVQSVTKAAHRALPEKDIQHGVTTYYDENEVALISQELHHTTSNNSNVDNNVRTAKEVLLNVGEELSKLHLNVNIQVYRDMILSLNPGDADHLLTAFTKIFTLQNTAARFRASFSLCDLVDKYWDIKKLHTLIPLPEDC